MPPFDNLKGISVAALMEISPVEEQEVGVPTGTETSEEVNEDIYIYIFRRSNAANFM